jgi:hypothetical protein
MLIQAEDIKAKAHGLGREGLEHRALDFLYPMA